MKDLPFSNILLAEIDYSATTIDCHTVDYYSARMATCLKENFLILSRYFTLFFLNIFFLLSLFKLPCPKKHAVYNLYRISYTLSFCYVVYCMVLEACVCGHFLEDRLYYCSEYSISAVVKETLISYNLIQRAPETQNL